MASGDPIRKLAKKRQAEGVVQAKFRHVYGLIGELSRACESDNQRLAARIANLEQRLTALETRPWWQFWR